VTPCSEVGGYQLLEEFAASVSVMVAQIFGILPQHYTVSQLTKPRREKLMSRKNYGSTDSTVHRSKI